MDKIIKVFRCPVCKSAVAQIVSREVYPKIAYDYWEHLPSFGGWAETKPGHKKPYCKDHIKEKVCR